MKYDKPTVAKILELHSKLSGDGNDIVLSWFLAMWVLEEIRLQTLLSRYALYGDTLDELISFSGLKTHVF